MCFSFCFSAVPPLRVLNFYAEAANYTHPTTEDHRNRITPNTSIHYTVHIYTPVVLFVFLFCFVSHPRSVSVRSKIPITRQNMSHKTEHVGHWEGLEMWLSATTNSILPKAAEALQHQTQDQLDDNITSIMRQDPSQNYNHKELAKITSSLSHTLIATLKLSDKHAAQRQQELTSAQRRIEQLERERQEGTDEEEINRLKEILAATSHEMQQLKEDFRWLCRQATVCREATREGKDWLQGQKQQNQGPRSSFGWIKKRDQPPNTTARLRHRGVWKFPRGTQARLRTTPGAVKDRTCTNRTPAKQDQVTCAWTDTWT